MISLNLRKERISLIQMRVNDARGEDSEQFMDVANLKSLHDPQDWNLTKVMKKGTRCKELRKQ